MLHELNLEIRKHYGDKVGDQFGIEVHQAFTDLEAKGIAENAEAMQALLNEVLQRLAPKFTVEGIYPAALVEWAYDDREDLEEFAKSEETRRALAVGGDPDSNPECSLAAEKIYEVLMSEGFKKWHETYFEDHVTGEEGCKNKEEILETIKEIFSLPDSPTEIRKFNLTIDADETFLAWLFENFDGEVQGGVCDLDRFNGIVVAEIEDANEGRWQKNMPLVKVEDGRVGWYDPDDNSITFSEGPVNLKKMFADLEAHEERQVHEEEEELND